jgi:hypothetical protein
MAWLTRIGIAVAVLMGAAVAGLACGDGDGGAEIDLSDVDAVVAGHLEALSEPGKVFHARAEWPQPEREDRVEVEEVWLDVDNGRLRREDRVEQAAEETVDFSVVVGADWTTADYDSSGNSVYTHIMTPEERAEAAAAGIDNFAYFGLEYLPILIGSSEKRVAGESTVEGRPVVLVETEWSMEPGGDWPEGATITMTVALDRSSLLPAQVGSKLIDPEGEEQPYGPFTFEMTEYVSPEDLPADFFSPQAVEELVVTLEEQVAQAQAQVEAAGFSLYWPGERYQVEGLPELYLRNVWVAKDASEASLHYAVQMAGFDLDDTVVIRQGRVGQAEFEPPPIPPIGSKPERQESVVVQGTQATLYISAMQPTPICAVESEEMSCTPVAPAVPAYHRLVLTLGDTVIQIEAVAKAQEEEDVNPFNNTDAITAVAEALVPVAPQP